MRRIYLLFLFCFIRMLYSQPTFIGMTSKGGQGFGTIFKTDGNGDNYSVLSKFNPNISGANPSYLKLCEAPNGKLYGMTQGGGAYNLGVIFEYDYITNTYIKKIDLNDTIGSSPLGSLILGNNGKLLGMTSRGGATTFGVIFEYDYITNTYTKKLDLNSTDGYYPYGTLLKAANGKFYGLAFYGGVNNKGTLFEYDYAANTYQKKIDLSSGIGNQPKGSLIEAAPGKLYGTTTRGGQTFDDDGVIFEYDYNTNVYTIKINFSSAIGYDSYGDLLKASNGKLYGLASGGGGAGAKGVLFEYDLYSNIYTKKIVFGLMTSPFTGHLPFGSLIQASNGKLYGLTYIYGVLFEYDYTTNIAVSKYAFTTINGENANGTLIQASDGNLYGTTLAGGIASTGVIFQYNCNSESYTKKADFGSLSGSDPHGTLTSANNGKFYGTTKYGGTSNKGTIFEYDYSTNSYTKKHDFDTLNANGYYPLGKMIQAPNGKLYGMTQYRSGIPNGVIFEYDITNNIYTKKIDFGVVDGKTPYGSLMLATNGKFYGMVSSGNSGFGGIFEYDYITNVYKKVFSLNGTTLTFGLGSLIEAPNGKLYGLTSNLGTGDLGSIFEFDISTNTYSLNVNLNNTIGSRPIGDLMFANNGKMYGMTSLGGANNVGVIFEYDYLSNSYIKKIDLSSSMGCSPNSSMIQGSNGKLYGMTKKGGVYNLGVIFEYDYNTNSYVKKLDFNGINGSTPETTNLIEVCSIVPTAPMNINGSTTVCQMSSVEYSVAPVAGAKFYTWSLPNGWSGTSVTNTITTNIGSLSGEIKVIANNECVSSSIVTLSVSVIQSPVLTINSGTICSGESFTISPSGADNYIYSGGLAIVSPTLSSSYTVTGTNTLTTCSSLAICSIQVNPSPTITVNSGSICAGNSFIISPSGANTYSYSGGSDVVSPTSNTSYSISGTDINGCVSNTAISSVTVNSLPIVTVNSGSVCAGNSFTISPSGANTYSYSSGNNVVSPIASTTYTMTGTDINNCVSNEVVSTVTVNALPIVTANSGTICAGNSFTIISGGADTYTYSSGSNIVSPTVDATYTVTGEDSNGCISNEVVSSVLVNPLPIITVNSGSICAGNSFTIIPNGANTYSYSGGSDVVSPTANAIFTVNGTDINGCENIAISSVTINALPPVMATTNNTLLCTGQAATLTASGATSYTWSTNEITNEIVISPTVSTTYVLDGTDANGCLNTYTITQLVDLCTDIVESNVFENLKIYPNPTTGVFTIEINTSTEISVTNILGEIILSEKLFSGKQAINIQNQPPGIYFINVVSNKNQQTVKLIKE